jgi:hypothetical protein
MAFEHRGRISEHHGDRVAAEASSRFDSAEASLFDRAWNSR